MVVSYLVIDCEFCHISRLVKTRSSLWCDVFQSAATAEGGWQDGDVYLISVSLPVVIGSRERGDFNHRRAFVCDGQAGNDISQRQPVRTDGMLTYRLMLDAFYQRWGGFSQLDASVF